MIVRRVRFRGILLLVGLGAMTGCGDGTGPLTPLEARYSLTGVRGLSLPALLDSSEYGTTTALAGSLTFSSDDSVDYSMTDSIAYNPYEPSVREYTFRVRYTRVAGLLLLHWEGGPVDTARVRGSTIVFPLRTPRSALGQEIPLTYTADEAP